jgi:hypothetical protein
MFGSRGPHLTLSLGSPKYIFTALPPGFRYTLSLLLY